MKRDYTIENLEQKPSSDICIGEIFLNKADGKLYTWLDAWDEFKVNTDGEADNTISRRLHAYNMTRIRKREALQFLSKANSSDLINLSWSVERFTEIKCFLRHMINEFKTFQNCSIELNDITWNDNATTIKIGSVNIEMGVTFMDNNHESHYSTLNFELLISGYMKIECICCIAYSYLRFVYCKQYFKFNDEKNIVNLLKIILLCIEHKIINEYQHDTQYIVCNSENTLLKIYHLLTNNEQQYLKQFYIIIKDNYNKYGIINKQSYIINIIKLFYLNKTILNNISQINILNLKSVLSDNIEDYYI
jgi:hypothetical protein